MKITEKATHGSLEITTATVCSVNCLPHCPQVKFRGRFRSLTGGGPAHQLRYEDFVTAIGTVPLDVSIVFAGFAEPFMNKRALDMMEYARRKGHRIQLFSTLVGLTPDQVPRLAALDPDVFVLHEPDNMGIAHIALTETYRETFFAVLTQMNIHGRSRMDKSGGSNAWNDRAGANDGAKKIEVKGPFYCGKLVEPEFILLPSGDVALCCMDWLIDHPIGNLLKQTWSELVESLEFRRVVRESGRLFKKDDTLCRRCEFAMPTFSYPRLKFAGYHVAQRLGLSPYSVGSRP